MYDVVNIFVSTKQREAILNHQKYFYSCDTYYTYGLIYRHIFALANANQEKDLEKIVINIRWKPPILDNQELIYQIDNFNFDSDK